MRINAEEMRDLLKQKMAEFSFAPSLRNEGRIISLADGIIQISGLSAAQHGEVVHIGEKALPALVMNLGRDTVGAVLLCRPREVSEGDKVLCTGEVLKVPVGPALLGRVVTALGEPVDELGPISCEERMPIEREAPGVLDRVSVNQPLATGYKAVDAMVPIGRGQRELLFGNRQTGKTALALDTILNQANSGVKCFYVAIGQKASTVVKLVAKLKALGALSYTTVVTAPAFEQAAFQYIAPYAACTMAEYFRDRGQHALIIYDDLSKHAVAYRQLSLLLRRPPGREAYPGDIFYLHSRLLERAASVNRAYMVSCVGEEALPKGATTGTLSALPIVETQGGDISSFVTTNVVSITDGQIFLDSDLFNAGVRPAVNPGQSVSRIGGAAQHPVVRKVAGSLRTTLAQYRELQAFSQFSSDLEASSRFRIEQGKKVTALLKQRQYAPLSSAEQSLLFIAVEEGYLKDIPLEKVEDFETALLHYARDHHAELLQRVEAAEKASKDLMEEIRHLLEAFKQVQAF